MTVKIFHGSLKFLTPHSPAFYLRPLSFSCLFLLASQRFLAVDRTPQSLVRGDLSRGLPELNVVAARQLASPTVRGSQREREEDALSVLISEVTHYLSLLPHSVQ